MTSRRRGRRSGPEPTALDALLNAVTTELTGTNHDDMSRLVDEWAQILGPELADGLVPVALVDGVLNVAVEDSARRAQLAFEETAILGRLNAFFGRTLVERLRPVRPPRAGSRASVW